MARTDHREATEQRQHAEAEHAALRRVATLVARDVPPEDVFQNVTEEVCALLGLRTAVLHRFEDARTSTIVGKFGEPTGHFAPGNVIELEEGTALHVLQTGAPARSSYVGLPGKGAAELRALGFRAGVGVPITVAGTTWGALIVALREGESLPPQTERRLQGFAELVALAVASAQARNELAASRLRIVEASDAERRRIERNLHDGAQQRLVAMSVGLRLARSKIRSAPDEAEELIAVASEELAQALEELRELARGIHPAVLTDRGLTAALEVLAVRAPLPVTVETHLPERLPEPVEAAAYYVVSEALANIAKHAGAEAACVRVTRTTEGARIVVEDDGAGGADPDRDRDSADSATGSRRSRASSRSRASLVRAPACARIFPCAERRRSHARRKARVMPQRLPKRRHHVALDHVQEHPGDGILPVEELPERVGGQDEQENTLSRDRCDRGRTTVDETLVAEGLSRAPRVQRGCAGRLESSPSPRRR